MQCTRGAHAVHMRCTCGGRMRTSPAQRPSAATKAVRLPSSRRRGPPKIGPTIATRARSAIPSAASRSPSDPRPRRQRLASPGRRRRCSVASARPYEKSPTSWAAAHSRTCQTPLGMCSSSPVVSDSVSTESESLVCDGVQQPLLAVPRHQCRPRAPRHGRTAAARDAALRRRHRRRRRCLVGAVHRVLVLCGRARALVHLEQRLRLPQQQLAPPLLVAAAQRLTAEGGGVPAQLVGVGDEEPQRHEQVRVGAQRAHAERVGRGEVACREDLPLDGTERREAVRGDQLRVRSRPVVELDRLPRREVPLCKHAQHLPVRRCRRGRAATTARRAARRITRCAARRAACRATHRTITRHRDGVARARAVADRRRVHQVNHRRQHAPQPVAAAARGGTAAAGAAAADGAIGGARQLERARPDGAQRPVEAGFRRLEVAADAGVGGNGRERRGWREEELAVQRRGPAAQCARARGSARRLQRGQLVVAPLERAVELRGQRRKPRPQLQRLVHACVHEPRGHRDVRLELVGRQNGEQLGHRWRRHSEVVRDARRQRHGDERLAGRHAGLGSDQTEAAAANVHDAHALVKVAGHVRPRVDRRDRAHRVPRMPR
eukprot:scaffold38804_cov63-Phaeocystis_antarctica.AAC.2